MNTNQKRKGAFGYHCGSAGGAAGHSGPGSRRGAAVGKWFTSQETAIRDGWAVDVGDLIGVEEEHQIEIRTASADASITVLQLVPTDIDQEGFTYYDTAVQQRIRAVLDKGQTHPEPQLDRRDPSGGAESLRHRGQWSVSVF